MDSFPFGHRPLNQFARRVTRCLTTTSRTNIGNPRLDPAQDHELCLPVGSAPTPRHRPLCFPRRRSVGVSAVRRASFHVPPCSSSSCGPAAHSAPLRKFLFHFWVSRDPDYSWIMCFIGVVAAAEARSVDAANLVQLVRRPCPLYSSTRIGGATRRPRKFIRFLDFPPAGLLSLAIEKFLGSNLTATDAGRVDGCYAMQLYILPFNLCVVLFTVPSPPARSSSPNPIRFFAFRRARLQGQFLPEPRQLKLQFSLSRERGYAFKFFPCGDLNVASTPTLAYSNHT
ncbi:hypothetical protein C8R43DRAFT_1107834 [Mycena crocata]|nr:hypothetical protein C8R43DRAFT_1107834 [Mycena crocata]